MRHTITSSIQTSAGTIAGVRNIEGAAEIIIDETIPENATTELGLAITVAALLSLFILSDKPLTIKTNSAGAPDDTINLEANEPFIWSEGDATLTADITALHVVSAAGNGDAVLKIRGLYDPTP